MNHQIVSLPFLWHAVGDYIVEAFIQTESETDLTAIETTDHDTCGHFDKNKQIQLETCISYLVLEMYLDGNRVWGGTEACTEITSNVDLITWITIVADLSFWMLLGRRTGLPRSLRGLWRLVTADMGPGPGKKASFRAL